MLNSTFSGLQLITLSPTIYGSIFIRLAVVASQICQIPLNSPKIRTYSSSRPSKIIDLGANRNRIMQLAVIHSSLSSISLRHSEYPYQVL